MKFIFLSLSIIVAPGLNYGHDTEQTYKSAPLKITILPNTEAVEAYEQFHPLTHYLEQKLNQKIILQIARDFPSFIRTIKQHDTDFSYQAAHVYLLLEDTFLPKTQLSTLSKNGTLQSFSHLVTRSDSEISSVEDLQGRSLLFGSEFSSVLTFSAKRLLKEHGIDLETDLQDYSFSNSCSKNAFNIYIQAFDAGFICDSRYAALMEGKDLQWPIPPQSLKEVAITEPSPNWVFTPLAHVTPATAAKMRQILLEMSPDNPEQARILDKINSGGFVATEEKQLTTLRNALIEP